MKPILIHSIGTAPAVRYAAEFLRSRGLSFIDHPAPEITHLLLDVPSFPADREDRDIAALEQHLQRLPQNITVIGGGLNHPVLEGYEKLDLLEDEFYLAANAAITAQCALQEAAGRMPTTFADTPVLVIGWGRIGKCLAKLLRALDARVSVAARKESNRAMLEALGFRAVSPDTPPDGYRLIINTAPGPGCFPECRAGANCVILDLASTPGLSGRDVIRARGLPGKLAPESSGILIGKTVLRRCREELR